MSHISCFDVITVEKNGRRIEYVYGYNVDYSGIGDVGIYTVTDGTGGTVSHSSPGDLARESSNLQVNTEGTDNI